MLATKNLIRGGTTVLLLLALFLAGCTPPGPRALLKGKKYIERGDYAAAVEQLQKATTLLPVNAQAWNYLGVAYQGDGQTTNAMTAYQKAFSLDRDLVEARFNLGALYLEQNRLEAARTEFTAYTLRRANAPEGWLKLGSAQLRGGDFLSAEKSFSTALYLSTNNPEALNGLGLARIQRGRPREATQFFAAAIQYHPDYAPALLNQAEVAQQYLHDNAQALKNYHAYLALKPRPANWDEVNAQVTALEQQPAPAAPASPPAAAAPSVTPAPPVASEPRTPALAAPRPAVSTPKPPTPTPSRVAPQPRTSPSPGKGQSTSAKPKPVATTENPAVEPPVNVVTNKPGVLKKLNPLHWFGGEQPKYAQTGLTPLPARQDYAPAAPPATNSSSVVVVVEKPPKILPPAAPVFPHYVYLSPRKPSAGDRTAASGAFTKAREFDQDSQWTDALDWYRHAREFDPGWFEAQYNYGVVAYRLRNYSLALSAYETALAIQPDSVDARYNFALTLKSAGYALDAVAELKKIVADHPGEVRAHLALGNLYAQQLRDYSLARTHYLKVLELDPRNPKANDIRFWLAANPA